MCKKFFAKISSLIEKIRQVLKEGCRKEKKCREQKTLPVKKQNPDSCSAQAHLAVVNKN